MKFIIFVLAAFTIAGWGILFVQVSENPKNSYVTIVDAENAGAIAAGWLPKYLPKSAIHISESHNMDTNQVWAAFKFKQGDTERVEQTCKKIAESSAGVKYLCPPYDTNTSTLVLKTNGEGYFQSFENGI